MLRSRSERSLAGARNRRGFLWNVPAEMCLGFRPHATGAVCPERPLTARAGGFSASPAMGQPAGPEIPASGRPAARPAHGEATVGDDPSRPGASRLRGCHLLPSFSRRGAGRPIGSGRAQRDEDARGAVRRRGRTRPSEAVPLVGRGEAPLPALVETGRARIAYAPGSLLPYPQCHAQ